MATLKSVLLNVSDATTACFYLTCYSLCWYTWEIWPTNGVL